MAQHRRSRTAKLGIALAALVFVGWLATRNRRPSPAIRPTATPATIQTPVVDSFDLFDMLPARAGMMKLARASTNRYAWSKRLESEKEEAIGRYIWAAERSRQAEVLLDVARVTCTRRAEDGPEACPSYEKKVDIMGATGCYAVEDSNGAQVRWGRCVLDFKRGALDGHGPDDLVQVAIDVQAWIDRVDAGNIAKDELERNRAALRKAMENAKLAGQVEKRRGRP
jgi:hypothetical protein